MKHISKRDNITLNEVLQQEMKNWKIALEEYLKENSDKYDKYDKIEKNIVDLIETSYGVGQPDDQILYHLQESVSLAGGSHRSHRSHRNKRKVSCKLRKTRKSRKSRKPRKSRKSRKLRKSRKVHKPRK